MNNKIIDVLSELSSIRASQNEKFSKAALDKVIGIISSLDFEITDKSQVSNIPGIGKKSLTYIDEILRNSDPTKTGIPELDQLDPNTKLKNEAIKDMQKISGIGPKKAEKYYSEYKIRNAEQLATYLGNTPQTNAITIGSKYHSDFDKKIPRSTSQTIIDYVDWIIKEINKQHGSHLKIEPGGSFRRGLELSGDLDLILYDTNGDDVSKYQNLLVTTLQNYGILKETIALGKDKYEGVATLPGIDETARRLDIEFVNSLQELPFKISYFIGSKNYNIFVRKRARELGYSLTHNGLYKLNPDGSQGERIEGIIEERQIYDLLGLPYLTPEQRNM